MSALSRQPSIGLGRFVASVLLPLAIGLGLFYLTMNPPMSDFSAMMELMLLTTLLSLVVAFAAYRLGWFNRLPRLQWSLLAVYVLAGVLVFHQCVDHRADDVCQQSRSDCWRRSCWSLPQASRRPWASSCRRR